MFFISIMLKVVCHSDSEIDWSSHIDSISDNEIYLIFNYELIDSTAGLASFSQITHLEMKQNRLESIGEIDYLQQLTFLDLTENQSNQRA